jgi:hypothetical protein
MGLILLRSHLFRAGVPYFIRSLSRRFAIGLGAQRQLTHLASGHLDAHRFGVTCCCALELHAIKG